MALPQFNEAGDLPLGLHPVSWAELLERFGAEHGDEFLAYWQIKRGGDKRGIVDVIL